MKPLQRVAFVGNYLPRRCGIATFTQISTGRSRPLGRILRLASSP